MALILKMLGSLIAVVLLAVGLLRYLIGMVGFVLVLLKVVIVIAFILLMVLIVVSMMKSRRRARAESEDF